MTKYIFYMFLQWYYKSNTNTTFTKELEACSLRYPAQKEKRDKVKKI